jgi:hypothetical protein
MSDNLVDKAKETREAREVAGRVLADLHAAMLDEIADAMPGGYMSKKFGLDLLRDSFEQKDVRPTLPEFVVEALCFYGRVCVILPPNYGESVQQHARRVNEWIADKWRKEHLR